MGSLQPSGSAVGCSWRVRCRHARVVAPSSHPHLDPWTFPPRPRAVPLLALGSATAARAATAHTSGRCRALAAAAAGLLPLRCCTASLLHLLCTRCAPAVHPLCTYPAPALHLPCARSADPCGRAAVHRARARAPRARPRAGCRRAGRRRAWAARLRRAAAARARVRAVRLPGTNVRPRIRCFLPRAPCAARYLRAPRQPADADTAEADAGCRRILHRVARPAAEPAVDHGLARGGEPCVRLAPCAVEARTAACAVSVS